MRGPIYFGVISGSNNPGAIIQGAIFLGGNYPDGNFPRGQLSGHHHEYIKYILDSNVIRTDS